MVVKVSAPREDHEHPADCACQADSVISTLFKPVKSFVGRDTANAPVTFVSVRPQNTFQEVLEKVRARRTGIAWVQLIAVR